MTSPQRVLVRGVNWLGDAVMTTPALLRLRERFRDAEITILSPDKLGALYLDHPAIDRVLMFARKDNVISIAAWLRDEQFDLGIVFPNSPRSALEVFLARAPQRVGYARPWRSWMLTHRVAERPNTATMRKRTPAEIRSRIATGAKRETFPTSAHHIHHYLHLVGEIGCNPAPLVPLVHVGDEEITACAERLNLKVAARPLFGLNAGAEYGPAKRWPEERFIETAIELHQQTKCVWLVLGGRGDLELAGRVKTKIAQHIGAEHVRNMAGETSLRELCAVLKRCKLLLTNDTGPMHLAAAVGTPVIVPFGSTSPELTGPGLPERGGHQLLLGEAACAPCFLRECPVDFRCMKNITAGAVIQAASRLHGAAVGRG